MPNKSTFQRETFVVKDLASLLPEDWGKNVNEKWIHKKGTFTFQDALNSIESHPDFKKVGAIASFIGVVRGETLGGKKVEKLKLEAYEEKAEETLSGICLDLEKRRGIVSVKIHHLIGEFDAGEEIVYALVASSHRKNLFSTLEEAVERYKAEVPVFKKEYVISAMGEKSSYWVSESDTFEKHKNQTKKGYKVL